MSASLVTALLIAVGAGLAIGGQTAIVNIGGQTIGPIQTGFLIHLMGALAGIVIIGIAVMRQEITFQSLSLNPSAYGYMLMAGMLGMVILISVGLSFPKTGQTAGQAAVILGQMTIAVLIDTSGILNKSPLPLDTRRIAGLILLVIATYLLLPRQ